MDESLGYRPRRDFLRQLAALPLVGGSVALIGQPTAVATFPTVALLESYKSWLVFEHRQLAWDMAEDPACQAKYQSDPRCHAETVRLSRIIHGCLDLNAPGARFHDRPSTPFHRAALVLSAVGADWREA